MLRHASTFAGQYSLLHLLGKAYLRRGGRQALPTMCLKQYTTLANKVEQAGLPFELLFPEISSQGNSFKCSANSAYTFCDKPKENSPSILISGLSYVSLGEHIPNLAHDVQVPYITG